MMTFLRSLDDVRDFKASIPVSYYLIAAPEPGGRHRFRPGRFTDDYLITTAEERSSNHPELL